MKCPLSNVDGTNSATFNPDEVGEWRIEITYQGNQIQVIKAVVLLLKQSVFLYIVVNRAVLLLVLCLIQMVFMLTVSKVRYL